jgi:hypothetical protein
VERCGEARSFVVSRVFRFYLSSGDFRAAAAGKGIELWKGFQLIGDVDQAVQGGRDVREKVQLPPFAAEKAIRPEGLHQLIAS